MEEEQPWTGPLTKKDLGQLNKSILSLKADFGTMLQTAIKDLKDDLATQLSAVTAQTTELDSRLSKVEATLPEIQSAHQATSEELQGMRSQLFTLQDRCEDLENRSRRENLRIKGLVEGDEGSDLQACLDKLFTMILQKSAPLNLKMDRLHRVGPRSAAGRDRPRDVLVKLHSFTQKEEILQAARRKGSWSFRNSSIQIYQDVAASTLQRRREMKPVTESLIQQKVRYRWLHPFGLRFGTYTVRSVEEGRQALEDMQLEQASTLSSDQGEASEHSQEQRKSRRRKTDTTSRSQRRTRDT